MNKIKYIIVPFFLLLLACHEKISEKEIRNLNGYWEIEKAVMPDGEVKEYTINSSIDYFQIKEGKGFRQKVMPQFDGDFLTNEVQEELSIVFGDNKAWISYHTDFADWKEEILVVKPNRLVLKNEYDIKYYYKRPVPFSKK